VIVGVNRFRDARIAPLNYATNDAQTVAKALGSLGFPASNITVLLDIQATKGEIERVLSSVVRRATVPADRLFLFFATHGMTVPLPGGGEEGYLLFHDTDPTDLPYTALSMSALKQMGQRIPARHILVAVDACYGGYSLVRAQAPPVLDRRYLELLAQSRVIQVITAGRKNQPVLEEQGHGGFTRKLLDGLLGHADSNRDSVITGTELAAWMHPRVAQASDNKQDMQFGNLDGEGQFFFLLPQVAVGIYPQQPQAPPATIVGNDGAEMVLVPAGEFSMGSEEYDDERPRHQVYLDALYIDKYEVTNARFQRFVQATGYRTLSERAGNSDTWLAPRGSGSSVAGLEQHPVVHVSREDAKVYCTWAGKRLPTEAEWEKAARGTDGRRYPWGNQFDSRQGNFAGENNGTVPVGSYEGGKSPYGAYDMAGNVWEWVADWYDANYYRNSPTRNPQGPASGEQAVLRGGGWDGNALRVRAPNRYVVAPAPRIDGVGFRCAKTL
jgi:formylglycine-generating enzyme